MSTILDLGALGTRGLLVPGEDSFDQAGRRVAAAGDFNGDGFDDVIIVASNGGANAREQVYTVYGGPDGPGSVDLGDLQPTDGFIIKSDYASFTASGAGDVNGDGFDDIIVGRSGGFSGYYYTYAGRPRAYVIFGHAAGSVNIDLDHFVPSDGLGFVVNGLIADSFTSFTVSAAGDVNGDGLADMIIGAPQDNSQRGNAYIIFGKPGGGFGTIDLIDLAPATGFRIAGAAPGDFTGSSVSAAGDVNGDGIGDFIIGASDADTGGTGSGVAYVIFGKKSGWSTINLANLTTDIGFRIQGDFPGDHAGASVSAAGDVNGDGYDDIIVGAPGHDDGGREAGEAYVIFGKAGGFANIDLSNLGAAGFVIRGDVAGDLAGVSVAGAGDVNRDGFDDIIIGAPTTGGGPGRAYLIFGKAGGFGTIDLTDLAPATGIVIQGAKTGDGAGSDVSGAGDVNKDGFADLIVGAPFAGLLQLAGQAYIISGNGPLASARNDFNGDGRSDILWQSDTGLLFNWVANPNGGFASNAGTFATIVDMGSSVAGTGDFNGDGRADILWLGSNGHLTDWLGTSSGGFINNTASFESSIPSSVNIVGIGDFNGDKRDDILFRSDAGLLFDWIATGEGGFTNNTANFSTVLGPEWKLAGTGDFNGDGRDDILWRENSSGRMVDWLGTSSGGFISNGTNFDSTLPSTIHYVGTGDFNGDGRDDILWRVDNGLVFDWLATSNGSFNSNTANFSTMFGTDWRVVSIGDFNADGRDDIFWRQDGTGHLVDWLGTASGSFATNVHNFDSSVPAGLHVEDTFL